MICFTYSGAHHMQTRHWHRAGTCTNVVNTAVWPFTQLNFRNFFATY
jgi:hypothetical protein